jgi:hypothetical protein
MFGLDFLFAAGLFALPVAGLPVLLHLLFRRKSPVVPFSTIRFVKTSLQRTAARRKLQRWLLLACRALLLLLLIWAIAQPAHRVASNWLGTAKTPIAAVVVDTSYSMLAKEQETTLLDRADAAVQSLSREQLKGARVALFKSDVPPADKPETLVDSGELLANWSPLQPTPAPVPLAERVSAALSMLQSQDADQKWLFVLTDFQAREFPRPVQTPADVRGVFLDLHADDARSAGIVKIDVKPERPIPGVGSEAVVTVAGRAGDSRAVTLDVADTTGKSFGQTTLVATLDRTGHGTVRFPLKLTATRWVTLTASIPTGDASAWDDARSQLVEVPPRRVVTVLTSSPVPPAERFIRLALDPSEGSQPAWPLQVKTGTDIGPDASVVVVPLTRWPDAARARALRQFALGGGTVVLALAPGLEESWESLPTDAKAAMAELLPGTPARRRVNGAYALLAGSASSASSVLEGLTDPAMQLSTATVRRFVPFDDLVPTSTTLLAASRSDASAGEKPSVIFATRPVGVGVAFTLATLPDQRFTNLPTHPVFLPLMVRAALSGVGGPTAPNVEIGRPIVLRDRALDGKRQLDLEGPNHDRFVVPAKRDDTGVSFPFDGTSSPGIYTVTTPGAADPVALANVQLPGPEAEPVRREASTVVSGGDNVVVARSVEELQSKFATLSEPEPKWSLPIAIVLLLLCFESLMGSVTTAWRWPFGRKADVVGA